MVKYMCERGNSSKDQPLSRNYALDVTPLRVLDEESLLSQQKLAHARPPTRIQVQVLKETPATPRSFIYLLLARHVPLLHSSRTRSISVFPQVKQKLAEALLSRTACTTLDTLAGHIHQLCDTFPASSAGRCVFSVGEEFLSFLAGLGASLVGAIAVGYVKVIDIFLCFLDGGCFLFGGGLGSAG